MEKLELRINFPFSAKKQPIYGDMVLECTDKKLISRYYSALEKEIESAAADVEGYQISGICFTGAPLNYGACINWQMALQRIKRDFQLKNVPIALHFKPDALSKDDIYHYVATSAETASVDMISFVDEELSAAGFTHTSKDNIKADLAFFDMRLRRYEIVLCYGLPGQTAESFLQSLKGAKRLFVDHISILPYGEQTEESRILYHEVAREYLCSEGYSEYAPMHFGKNDIRISFYAEPAQQYLGFGMGARSKMDGMEFANTGDLGLYLESSDDFSKIAIRLS